MLVLCVLLERRQPGGGHLRRRMWHIHQYMLFHRFEKRERTNGCLHVWQMMFFDASFTFNWLLPPFAALSWLRSRFCCALAP